MAAELTRRIDAGEERGLPGGTLRQPDYPQIGVDGAGDMVAIVDRETRHQALAAE